MIKTLNIGAHKSKLVILYFLGLVQTESFKLRYAYIVVLYYYICLNCYMFYICTILRDIFLFLCFPKAFFFLKFQIQVIFILKSCIDMILQIVFVFLHIILMHLHFQLIKEHKLK